MADPKMVTLKLDPVLPDLTPAVGTEITLRFDRDVLVVGKGIVASKDAVYKAEIPRSGSFPRVDVPVNDDPSLMPGSEGFAIIVECRPGPSAIGDGVSGGPWTILIDSKTPSVISLSHLDHNNVVQLPPGMNVSDVLAQVATAQSTASEAVTEAKLAVTTSNSAKSTASTALTTANEAKAVQTANAAGPDAQVAGYVNTSGTATKTALDAKYMANTTTGDGTPDAATSTNGTLTNLATNPGFRTAIGSVVLPTAAQATVKVGTYNMRLSSVTTDTGDKAWANRKTAFAGTILDSGAAVVALQEVSYVADPARSQAGEAVAEMNAQIGTANRWQVAAGTSGSDAIVWDNNVVALDEGLATVPVNVANTIGEGRAMVWCVFRVRSTNARFIFVCTHWQQDFPDVTNGQVRRAESSTIVADHVDALRARYGLPAIIGADFNDADISTTSPRGTLAARGYLAARSVSTTTPTNTTLDSYNGFDAAMTGKQNGAWIDGIHCSPGITVSAVGLVAKFASGSAPPLATPLPSDHNMLAATCAITCAPTITQQGAAIMVTTGGGASAYQTYDGTKYLCTVNGQGATSATGTSVYLGPRGTSTLDAAQLGLTVGQTYTISVDCIIPVTLGDSSSTWARAIVVTTYDANGTGTNKVSTAAAKTAGTTRLTLTFTATAQMSIRLYHGYNAGLVQWANVMLQSGSSASAYNDGNSSGWWWGTKISGLSLGNLVRGTLPATTAKALADAVRSYL